MAVLPLLQTKSSGLIVLDILLFVKIFNLISDEIGHVQGGMAVDYSI